eukprot:10856338-Alexandrium_andersonii.AAC.1
MLPLAPLQRTRSLERLPTDPRPGRSRGCRRQVARVAGHRRTHARAHARTRTRAAAHRPPP